MALSDLVNGAGRVYDTFSGIDSFSSGLEAVRTLGSLFTGTGPISLGDFDFTRFEVPEIVTHGTRQKLETHTMPGGRRVIDAMGPEELPITWNGRLIGVNAGLRARQLKAMCQRGRRLVLRWGINRMDVVIQEASFEDLRREFINYKIECVALNVQSAPGKPGLLESVTADIGAAIGVDLPATLSDVSSTIAAVRPLAQGLVTLTGGSKAAQGILGGLNTASTAVAGAYQVSTGQLAGIATTMSTITTSGRAIGAITGLVGAAEAKARLGQVQGYLGRAANSTRGAA